jgi:hypothetical protein
MKNKVRTCFFSALFAIHAGAFATDEDLGCKTHLRSQPGHDMLFGPTVESVKWSTTDTKWLATNSVPRLSIANVRFLLRRNGNVGAMIVALPNGSSHKIRIWSHFQLSPETVWASGVQFLPLDGISLLKKLWFAEVADAYGNKVLGMVVMAEPRTILLHPSAPPSVLAHEMGHVLQLHTWLFPWRWRRVMKRDGTLVGRYASTQAGEDFAESFVLYLEPDENRRTLYREQFPHRFEWIDQLLAGRYRNSVHPLLTGMGFIVGGVLGGAGLIIAVVEAFH